MKFFPAAIITVLIAGPTLGQAAPTWELPSALPFELSSALPFELSSAPSSELPPVEAAGPSAMDITRMNLGKSGQLAPFYSDTQLALTGVRVAQSRSRVNGIANAPPGALPTTGFENEGYLFVFPWQVRTALDGNTNIYLKVATSYSREGSNIISDDADLFSNGIGVEYAYSPNGLINFDIGYRAANVDQTTGTLTLARESVDLRAIVGQKFLDNWGVNGRVFFSKGVSELSVTTPDGLVETDVSDYQIYGQFDLIGNFVAEELSIIPQQWTVHPTLGISLLHSNFNQATNSLGDDVAANSDDYGAVYGSAILQRNLRPGGLSPVFELGVEHVFLDDLSDFSDETTYGIIGAGLAYMLKPGSAFFAGYNHREGFKQERSYGEFALAFNITF